VTAPKGKSGPKPRDDPGARLLGNQPRKVMTILTLLQRGTPVEKVVEIGEFHDSWTEPDVHRVLEAHGIRPVTAPFGGGAIPAPDALVVRLTPVQTDVLRELCTGATNEQIGARLFLSTPIVRRHLDTVARRMNAVDRTHVACLVLTGRVRVAVAAP